MAKRAKKHTTKWSLLLSRLRGEEGLHLFCTVTLREVQDFDPETLKEFTEMQEREAWRTWNLKAGVLPAPEQEPRTVSKATAHALLDRGLIREVRTWKNVPGAIRCVEYEPAPPEAE